MAEVDQFKVEILKGKGFGLRLLYRGDVFMIKKRSADTITWTCIHSGCKSTINIVDYNLPLPILVQPHNHPPDPLKVAAARIRPTVATILWVPTKDQKYKRLVVGNKPLDVVLAENESVYDDECPVDDEAGPADVAHASGVPSKPEETIALTATPPITSSASTVKSVTEPELNSSPPPLTTTFTPIITPVPLSRMQQPQFQQSNANHAATPSLSQQFLAKQPQSTNLIQTLAANYAKTQSAHAQLRVVAKQLAESKEEEVCLKWNNHQGNMQNTLPSLLHKGQYTDCTLCAEGRNIQVHKLVLSSCSPYFEEVFSCVSPWQHPVVILKDISYDILSALVSYIYSGEVRLEKKKLEEFYNAAYSLKIKGLASKTVTPPAPSTLTHVPVPPAAVKLNKIQPSQVVSARASPIRIAPAVPPLQISQSQGTVKFGPGPKVGIHRPNSRLNPKLTPRSKLIYKLALPKNQMHQISLEEAKTVLTKRSTPPEVICASPMTTMPATSSMQKSLPPIVPSVPSLVPFQSLEVSPMQRAAIDNKSPSTINATTISKPTSSVHERSTGEALHYVSVPNVDETPVIVIPDDAVSSEELQAHSSTMDDLNTCESAEQTQSINAKVINCEVRYSPSFAKKSLPRLSLTKQQMKDEKTKCEPRRGTKSRPCIQAPDYYNVGHKSTMRHKKSGRRCNSLTRRDQSDSSILSESIISKPDSESAESSNQATSENPATLHMSETPEKTTTTDIATVGNTQSSSIPHDPIVVNQPEQQSSSQEKQAHEFNISNVKTEPLDVTETGVSYSDCVTSSDTAPEPEYLSYDADGNIFMKGTSTSSAAVVLPSMKLEAVPGAEPDSKHEESAFLGSKGAKRGRKRRKRHASVGDSPKKSSIDIRSLKEKLQSKVKPATRSRLGTDLPKPVEGT